MKSKEDDVNESILSQFEQHAKVLLFLWNLQHVILCKVWQIASRLQKTGKKENKPKVVLTWAPHIKPIAHAVETLSQNGCRKWM
jgi:N-succinyl-L-ornithine transcarbamylase